MQEGGESQPLERGGPGSSEASEDWVFTGL